MDCVGASSEMNWSAFNGMVSADETEFLSQLLGSYPFADDPDSDLSFELPATFWSGHEAINMVMCDNDSYYHCLDALESSLINCLPQGNNDSLCIPSSDYENHYIGDANIIPPIDSSTSAMGHCMGDEQKTSSLLGIVPDNLYEETAYLNEEMNADDLGEPSVNPSEQILLNQKMQRKRKPRVSEPDKVIEEKANRSQAAKKRTRVKGDVRRNANSTHSTKTQKVNLTTHEEESSPAVNGKNSSGYYSEDDSIGSQEINGGMSSSSKGSPPLNSNRTTRASRGSATDPQSLYARKRRERINQKLRILQNLVPNGTKVDISTMLEEAVQYVKFLQLQIKLLSSDDLWMYAPIAYNGKDIGLNLMISAP